MSAFSRCSGEKSDHRSKCHRNNDDEDDPKRRRRHKKHRRHHRCGN